MINKDKKNPVQQGKCSVTARLITGRLAANAKCLLQRCAGTGWKALAISLMAAEPFPGHLIQNLLLKCCV